MSDGLDPSPERVREASAAPKPPRVWPAFLALALGLLVPMGLGVLEGLAVTVKLLADGADPTDAAALGEGIKKAFATPGLMLLNIAVSSLTFLGLAGLGAALSPAPWRSRLRAAASSLSPWTLAFATATFLAFSLVVARLGGILLSDRKGTTELIAGVFTGASPAMLLLGLLVVGLLGGVCEEVFFRGYFQTRVVARWGRWPGIMVTAAVFGLVHLDLLQGLFAFPIGVFLGWLTVRTGSIRPAMVAHVANNLVFGLFSAAGFDRLAPVAAQTRLGWLWVAFFASLAAAGIARLGRTLPRGEEAPAGERTIPSEAPAGEGGLQGGP